MRSACWIPKLGVWALIVAFVMSTQGCGRKYKSSLTFYVLCVNPPSGVLAPVNTLIGAVFTPDCDVHSVRVWVADSKGRGVYGRLETYSNFLILKPFRNLSPGETYEVRISNIHAVGDTSQVYNIAFSFKTSDEVDETPPRITRILQLVNVDGSIKRLPLDVPVRPDGAFLIVFSEPMFQREFNPRSGIIIEPGVVESMHVTFPTVTEARLDVNGLLEDTTYTIKLKKGLFWDLAGNPTPEHSFTFRTEERE